MKQQKNKKFELKYLISIFWILCFIISSCILIIIPVLYNMNSNSTDKDTVYIFEDNWKILLDEKLYMNNVSFPCKINKEQGKFTLINVLPDNEELPNYPAIHMKLKYMDADFYIDDKLIYKSYSLPNLKSKGTFYHTQILPEGYKGKIIKIELKPLTSKTTFQIYPPEIGTKSAIFIKALNQNWISVILNNLMLYLGLVFFLIYIILKKISQYGKNFLLLGIFMISYSIYYFARNEITTYFVENTFFLYAVNYFLFSILPIITLKIGEIYCDKKYKNIFNFLQIVSIIFAMFQLIVGTFYKYEYAELSFPSFIIKNISIFTVAVLLYFTKENENKQRTNFFISFIPILIGHVVGVFIHYSPLTYDEVNVEKIGIIIFAVIQIYYILKVHFKFYRDALDKEIFEKLAYTDLMTKINNRAAFERDINEIVPSEDTFLIEIDVNCLKYVNDNMGHVYGDKLIIEVSTILKKCCDLYNFYRIGGDEFIVILKTEKEQDVIDLIKEMKQMALNSTCEFDISFACGYSNCKGSVQEALKKADKMMYDDKIIYKKQKNILE